MKKFHKIALFAAFAAMQISMAQPAAEAAAEKSGIAPALGQNNVFSLTGERVDAVFQNTAVRQGDLNYNWEIGGVSHNDDVKYRNELKRIQSERRQLERDIERLRREEARLSDRRDHARYRSEKKRIEQERKAKERRLKEVKKEEERLQRQHHRG